MAAVIGEDRATHPDVCGQECSQAAFGAHAHFSPEGEGDLVELTIQPFHWGHEVSPRPSALVGWWVLRAAVAVMLLQLVSPWGVIVRRARWVADVVRSHRRRAMAMAVVTVVLLPIAMFAASVALVVWFVWLLLRAALFLAVGIAAFLVLPLYGGLVWLLAHAIPRLAEAMKKPVLLVNDALAWCSDDGFRRWVIAECTARISAAKADHHVLIGHSQGGSILTEWTREADLRTYGVTLLTLGSGQGILATLHEALKRWRVVYSAVAVVVVVGFVVAAIFLIWVFLSELPGIGPTVQSWVVLVQAAWLGSLVREDYLVDAARRSADGARGAVSAALETLVGDAEPSLALTLATLVVSMAAFMLFGAVLLIIRPLAQRITARCATTADGIDLSATRDPISRPLHVLAGTDRLRRVPQTGSVTLDHVLYAANGIVVRPTIKSAVVHAISGTRFDANARAAWDGEYRLGLFEHRTQLEGLTILRSVTGFLALIPVLALFTPGDHDYAMAVVLVAMAAATWWSAAIRAVFLLRRNAALSATGALAEIGQGRTARRSSPRAAILVIVSLLMLGALLLPDDLRTIVRSASIRDVEGSRSFAISAFFLALCAAYFFRRGSRVQRPVAFAAFVLAAASWGALGSLQGRGWCVAIVVVGVGIVFLPLRPRRVPEPALLRGP